MNKTKYEVVDGKLIAYKQTKEGLESVTYEEVDRKTMFGKEEFIHWFMKDLMVEIDEVISKNMNPFSYDIRELAAKKVAEYLEGKGFFKTEDNII